MQLWFGVFTVNVWCLTHTRTLADAGHKFRFKTLHEESDMLSKKPQSYAHTLLKKAIHLKKAELPESRKMRMYVTLVSQIGRGVCSQHLRQPKHQSVDNIKHYDTAISIFCPTPTFFLTFPLQNFDQ